MSAIDTQAKLIDPRKDRDEQIAAADGWVSYGNVTHVEACRLHAERFPWRHSVMVTRRVGERGCFTHTIARKIIYHVTPRRRES